MNIKQSLVLELQRTQITLKQLEMVQRQHLLQGKVKEARDVEQKINLLLQRQKQVIHTIQTASWDGNVKKNVATLPVSSGTGASTLNTVPTSSLVTQAGGATSQVGGATSHVGGASLQAGRPIPPIPSLLASSPHTVGQASSHTSTTASLQHPGLSSAVLPRSLPLSIHSITAPSSAGMSVNSPPVVCSPSFVAVSSAFTYLPSASLQSNHSSQPTSSLQSTSVLKPTHSLHSTPSLQPNPSTSLYASPAVSVSASHAGSMGQFSTATTVTQAPGVLPKSVVVSSSAHHPNPAQSVALHSDNVITAQEALLLLNNPTLQEKLTMEKLQHLNSIRLQALNDYQRQRIQAFIASLPPHEVPKDIAELKKVLQEKGFQIQVRMVLCCCYRLVHSVVSVRHVMGCGRRSFSEEFA